MSAITSVFFWFDGVLAPPLWRLTRIVLEANEVKADAVLCLDLIDLGRKLRAGAMSCDEYCRHVIELASAPLSPEQLAAMIERRIEATAGVLKVIDELSDLYHPYMLFDYPHAWLFPALSQTGLARRFPDHRIVIMDQYSNPNEPDAVPSSLARLQVAPREVLLIDSDPRRAMALFRMGLKIVIFIDARRLRRDLVLWKMLPPDHVHVRPRLKTDIT